MNTHSTVSALPITIKHDQVVCAKVKTFRGERLAFGHVGTIFGYTDPETIAKLLPMWRERGDNEVWVGQDASMICNDRSYYANLKAEREGAIEIMDGQFYAAHDAEGVEAVWVAKINGDYSNMVEFKRMDWVPVV